MRRASAHFAGHQPTGTLVGTPALAQEALLLEIECVAVIG